MNTKRIFALMLALVMVLSLAACGASEPAATEAATEAVAPDAKHTDMLNQQGQIYVGVDEDVEVNVADVHMDAAEAFAAGQWEALFTPVEVEGRGMDMANFDLTPTAEELEAMKNEPAYGGDPLLYMIFAGCSSGTSVADLLGYYEEAGLNVEGMKGESYVEALGSGQAHVAICHIATNLVPITNGVDITFVGGAHIACKSLYVLADSEYHTPEDLKGTNISVPAGIGASDYNITALLLDDNGINPQTDVNLVHVTTDACYAAMENGEISAALLSDVYAYGMVKDGKLRAVSSMLDSDFSEVCTCCAISMNRTFVKENPVHTKKMVQAIQKALCWMRENPEEATDLMLENKLNSGDREMNIMINNSEQFGISENFFESNLREIVSRYIRLGLITNMDDVEEVMDLAWSPSLN